MRYRMFIWDQCKGDSGRLVYDFDSENDLTALKHAEEEIARMTLQNEQMCKKPPFGRSDRSTYSLLRLARVTQVMKLTEELREIPIK